MQPLFKHGYAIGIQTDQKTDLYLREAFHPASTAHKSPENIVSPAGETVVLEFASVDTSCFI